MKKAILFVALIIATTKLFAQTDYTATVVFPAGYAIGDYVEFLKVNPLDAGASGYYEISISYTRSNVAAAATHLASISHANPAIWREVGRVNNNVYQSGATFNFTIDCNSESNNNRFRIRAISVAGDNTAALTVHIKVHSINQMNATTPWTALSATGNDLTVTKFIPMTYDWSLYVGNNFSSNDASVAIKALSNGNVGIGTATPDAKLAVKGTIHTQSVKIDMVNWADYVLKKGYQLPQLSDVKEYIDRNQHLPQVPSEEEMIKNGLDVAEMNKLLMKKVEELTLYLIEKDETEKEHSKTIQLLQSQLKQQQQQINKELKGQKKQVTELKKELKNIRK